MVKLKIRWKDLWFVLAFTLCQVFTVAPTQKAILVVPNLITWGICMYIVAWLEAKKYKKPGIAFLAIREVLLDMAAISVILAVIMILAGIPLW